MIYIIISLVFLCLFCLWRRYTYFTSRGINTPPPVPLFGNMTAVTFGRENFYGAIETAYNTFKDQRYFGFYEFLKPILILKDLELIQQILVRDVKTFQDRGVSIGADCDPLVGRALFILKGSQWKRTREILTPAFSSAKCKTMLPLMIDSANAMVQHLNKTVPKDGKLINVNDIVMRYVNDVIAICAFGFKVNSYEEPDNCIYKLGLKIIVNKITQVMKLFGAQNVPAIMKFFRLKIISSNDAQLLSNLFKNAMQRRRENMEYRSDFIQVLVDTKQKEITDDDLVSQALLFYFAGFDTTSTLVNYFLHELALNPSIQKKVLKEIDRVPGNYDIKDLYEIITKLEYLDMCVNEVLRKWPLFPYFDRRLSETYDFGPTFEGGTRNFTACTGLHVWVPVSSIHRDEKYWPNPEKFIPERFSRENKSSIVPCSYLPFGAGPRHCIGSRFALQSAKVFLFNFLRNYEVVGSEFSSRICPRALVIRPINGFNLTIKPRNHC